MTRRLQPLFAVVLLASCLPAAVAPAVTPTHEPTPDPPEPPAAKPPLQGPDYQSLLVGGCAIIRPRVIACLTDARPLGGEVRWQPIPDDFGPDEAFVHLDSSGDRLCALLRPSGRVACWSTLQPENRRSDFFPVPEFEPTDDAVDFGLLTRGACALDTAGTVRCWGENDGGQLGDGTRVARGVPQVVKLPAPAVDIETAFDSACALLETGAIHCWGGNDTPGDPRRLIPEPIRGLQSVAQLEDVRWARLREGGWAQWDTLDHVPHRGFTTAEAVTTARARSTHSDCWLEDTALWCETGWDTPPETYFDDVVDFDHDRHHSACVRRADDSVWCRGSQTPLKVAAPEVPQHEPTQVPGLERVSFVAAARSGACAIHDGGAVSCWGFGNHLPHHPRQRPAFLGSPTRVPLPGPADRLLVAPGGACARVEGAAHCWGSQGQVHALGPADTLQERAGSPCADDGTTLRCLHLSMPYRREQVREVTRPDPTAIEAWGNRCTRQRGRVRCERPAASLTCTGSLDAPEPCTTSSTDAEPLTLTPQLRSGGSDTVLVGAGGVCTLRPSGHLRCSTDARGWPSFRGTSVDAYDIETAAVGSTSVCAVDRSAVLRCWAPHDQREDPFQLGIDDAVSVSVGATAGYAIREDGTLWSWGQSINGERGLGGWWWKGSEIPVEVPQLGPAAVVPEIPEFR